LNWLSFFIFVQWQTTQQMVVDILLVLGECHRNYRNARFYAERYPDRHHPNSQQVKYWKKISSKFTSSTEITESKH